MSSCFNLVHASEKSTDIGAAETGAVLSTVVDRPEDEFGLTHLRFGKHILKVQRITAPRGEPVRVRIPARHVAVALALPPHNSFQNIFAGEIREIIDQDAPFVDVRLGIGAVLWARITRQSLQALGLKTGQTVFALIKSVSIS